jgi:hypothetical protein
MGHITPTGFAMVLVLDRGRVKGRKIVDAGIGILDDG